MDNTYYGPLRIYIASAWENRANCQALKRVLESAGAIVTSSWLRDDHEDSSTNMAVIRDRFEECRVRSTQDIRDIDDASVFVIVNPTSIHRSGTGGRHVETGYALASNKAIVLFGERENVFHYLPRVSVVKSENELLQWLHL